MQIQLILVLSDDTETDDGRKTAGSSIAEVGSGVHLGRKRALGESRIRQKKFFEISPQRDRLRTQLPHPRTAPGHPHRSLHLSSSLSSCGQSSGTRTGAAAGDLAISCSTLNLPPPRSPPRIAHLPSLTVVFRPAPAVSTSSSIRAQQPRSGGLERRGALWSSSLLPLLSFFCSLFSFFLSLLPLRCLLPYQVSFVSRSVSQSVSQSVSNTLSLFIFVVSACHLLTA